MASGKCVDPADRTLRRDTVSAFPPRSLGHAWRRVGMDRPPGDELPMRLPEPRALQTFRPTRLYQRHSGS